MRRDRRPAHLRSRPEQRERGIDAVMQNGVPLPLLIGLDAHDRDAKAAALALRDAGFEVHEVSARTVVDGVEAMRAQQPLM